MFIQRENLENDSDILDSSLYHLVSVVLPRNIIPLFEEVK